MPLAKPGDASLRFSSISYGTGPARPAPEQVNLEVEELRKTECRRCLSSRLLILGKRRKEDNDVYRCRDCGYLFSPPPSPAAPLAGPSGQSG